MKLMNVFLSYSARDTAVAAQIEKALEGLGLSAFNPAKDIGAGADWRKSVQAAIRKSDMVLLLVASPDTVANSWMSYEAGMADALGKDVVALVPDRYPVSQLPPDVAVRQVLRLDPNSPERAARDIASRLAAA